MKNKKVLYNITKQQTKAISEAFSELVRAGDTLLLFGDVGSGKTFFSRLLIQKMMKKQGAKLEDIPSPTFAIIQVYDTLLPSVWHLDLYRLSNSEEIIDLDLENALEKGVCLIEWPEKMGAYAPQRNISITLEQTEGAYDLRNISLEFNGSGWDYITTGLTRSLVNW